MSGPREDFDPPFDAPEFTAWTRSEESLAAAQQAHDDALATFCGVMKDFLAGLAPLDRLKFIGRIESPDLPPVFASCLFDVKMGTLTSMPYQDYLRTDHWQSVREVALERAEEKCQLCSSTKRLHVHHRTYDHRGYEAPDDVTVLCAGCHQSFHDHRRLVRD